MTHTSTQNLPDKSNHWPWIRTSKVVLHSLSSHCGTSTQLISSSHSHDLGPALSSTFPFTNASGVVATIFLWSKEWDWDMDEANGVGVVKPDTAVKAIWDDKIAIAVVTLMFLERIMLRFNWIICVLFSDTSSFPAARITKWAVLLVQEKHESKRNS